MDESQKVQSIKFQTKKTTLDEISFQSIDKHNDENSLEECSKYFSIDNDDIVLLDSSQIILHDVKYVLNRLINNVLNFEGHQSQITNLSNKRSLNINNNEEYFLNNKKVRFNLSNENQQLLPYLFISETIHSINQSKPYDQFLYNLGFDLCLEQYHNENNTLSELQKNALIKYNKIFHQCRIYSCKYCSFKTDTIHVLDRHYRTPHTLSNSMYRYNKYQCTYCSFQTFRIPELRRHLDRKHGYVLIIEQPRRRYTCSYCPYETDDKHHFMKHNKRCQIEQRRVCIENKLLAPYYQFNRNMNQQITTVNTKFNGKTSNQSIIKKSSLNTTQMVNQNQIIEPIIIELDHDTSASQSSSDEDFIVSSDEESSSTTDDDDKNDRDFEYISSRSKKSQQHPIFKSTTSLISHPTSITPMSTTLTSLSKLLLLNGTPIPTFTTSSPLNINKPPLVPIQPKPTAENDIYQMCNICECYVFKKDYIKHMNEKHNNLSIQSQPTNSTPITILNNTSINSQIPALIVAKTASQPQPPSTILLLSTSIIDPQSITLNMIKCPWCDTNFQHIDIMTGHLMRYHRMTLAASKVVVAEQMKIQGTSSSQLSLMFKQEIDQIQKEFTDKIYWKISQPKIYLHQIDNLSCFMCHVNIDNIENHFMSSHQIQLTTMNKIKQCCLCGYQCMKNHLSIYEHQLRTHSGVCYSFVLKQFIRFEPPPPPLSKDNKRLILPSSLSHKRTLRTYTEKKFGCRKCDTSSRLFTFEELIEHLHLKHELNITLHRRCIICQQTYLKGKEYNQHCLEHLNDENPSIKIKRYYKK